MTWNLAYDYEQKHDNDCCNRNEAALNYKLIIQTALGSSEGHQKKSRTIKPTISPRDKLVTTWGLTIVFIG